MSERPLLLHSLAEFRSVIFPVLDAVAPRRVVELGGEGGLFTKELASWGATHGAHVACIEPLPNPTLAQLADEGKLQLVKGKSPAALTDLEPFDLYIVDGDHNFHVVSGELAAIFAPGRSPVAVLHDVAWPCARRDQYYAPDDVPPEHRQPYDYERGARPGQRELGEGGFRGAGQFAYAVTEGGPANGVLTAVEDLLGRRDDLEFVRVPAIFGLGVVFPTAAPFAGALRQLLAPYHENDLLRRLEENRLDLYLAVLDAQDEIDALGRRQRALLEALQQELDATHAENARLRLELAGTTAASS